MPHSLETQGRALLRGGFHILPIEPGTKSPNLKGWTAIKADEATLDRWIAEGKAGWGVGILGEETPAVDLDIVDEGVLAKMLAFCDSRFGAAPRRVGRPPRLALVFRTDEPFGKFKSRKYVDDRGGTHQVEIIGKGGQFVAYAIHPDTKKPYAWPEGDLTDYHADLLPTLSEQDARSIVTYFESIVPPTWQPVQSAAGGAGEHPSNPAKTASLAAVESAVRAIPNADLDYGDWIRVGYALWAAVGHDKPTGCAIFHEWSAKSDKYDADFTQAAWDGIKEVKSLGAGTLFHLAEGAGWTRPRPDAASEFEAVDIDVGEPPAPKQPEILDTKEKAVAATPYVFVDPATIPPRDWLLGRHLIRKFVSVTVAPGNIGKSSLTIAEALAMTTGKNLLRQSIHEPLRVWYWNLEDPYDELQRRIQAACQHYGLGAGDIGGRLFVDSGREKSLRTAISDKNGTRIVRPVVDGLAAEMLRLRIDCIIVDPFVSSHGVPENDNPAIDMVAKEWGRIAERANAAVELVHHTRKQGGEEITTESSRGGKALTDAARDVRVLNRMTKEEGDRAGVENHRLYFRTYSDKANMSPPADRSDWFKLESVGLANGDDVGVVTPWEWPDPFQDLTLADVRKAQEAIGGERCRADVRSSDWVGLRVASALGIDVDTANGRERVKKLVAEWVEKDWLRKGIARDEKGKDRPVVYVGKSVLQMEFEAISE